MNDKELAEWQRERRYGAWAGNPLGAREDKTRCVCSVMRPNTWVDSQCSRKRGYGNHGLYCKQHAKTHPEIKDE